MTITAGTQVTWKEETQEGKVTFTKFRDGIVKNIAFGVAVVLPFPRGKAVQVPVTKLSLPERKSP